MQEHDAMPNLPNDLTQPPALPPQAQPNADQPAYFGEVYRFQFHGKAAEYFGIWFVNILLTIVTLSFYSPWAKVRRLRYFYQHSEFFQRSFDFTGLPSKILIGRLIAIGIWVAFAIAAQLEMRVAAFGTLAIYLALPWLLRATIRFTARNSKYSNSRFYFEGSTKQAYLQFLLGLLITVATLGLFAPVMIWLYKRYIFDHLYIGQIRFKLKSDWSDYMAAVYLPIVIFIGVVVVVTIITYAFFLSSTEFLPSTIMSIVVGLYILVIFFIAPLIQARIFITTWNNMQLGNSQFKTDCNQWRFAWIVVSNWLVKIISLGLMSPWAAIRIYKYQVESLSLLLTDDLDQMMNQLHSDPSAIGEEISDIFDLDISL